MAPWGAVHIDIGSLGLACGAVFLASSSLRAQPSVPPVKTKSGAKPAARPAKNPCTKCRGERKLLCGDCEGVGRLNYRGQVMLPPRVCPVWCPYCRGTGMANCTKCFGTGQQQNMIGFRPPS